MSLRQWPTKPKVKLWSLPKHQVRWSMKEVYVIFLYSPEACIPSVESKSQPITPTGKELVCECLY